MMKRRALLGLASCLLLCAAPGLAETPRNQTIEAGFRLLYELKFDEARSTFQAWQKESPDDPLGPAAEAASYLFEEFYRQGALTSEFFLDDKKLLDGIDGKPDPKLKENFLRTNAHAQESARRRLAANSGDTDALYVLTITSGMLGNYAGLIEKRHFDSLKFTREAEKYARKLLALKPDSQDAYLALGASNYIIGCLPVYKRFFLFFGGIRGDKEEGMKQLSLAAVNGHYLRPYAKILLALAALREEQPALARTQLEELVAEFPGNPLFARELELLKKAPAAGSSRR